MEKEKETTANEENNQLSEDQNAMFLETHQGENEESREESSQMIPHYIVEPEVKHGGELDNVDNEAAEPENETIQSGGSPRPQMRILAVEKDTRTVLNIKERRKASSKCCNSQNARTLFGDPVLFVEPSAVWDILRFTHWGENTEENNVEQAALIYGRLCECNRFIGGPARWGEVCGIIPAEAELATPLSIRISADEWKRLAIRLDEINHEAEENGEETYVSLGWMHTHPHQLDPFFSSVDVELQRTIMDNDDLFGLVINPQRQIFSCFKDADSKPCKAVFELTEELIENWSFKGKIKAISEVSVKETTSAAKEDDTILVMKSRRENHIPAVHTPRLIPITYCKVDPLGEATRPTRYPLRDNYAMPADSFFLLTRILNQTKRSAEMVAVVILEEHNHIRLISLVPKEYFPSLRSAMDREWYDYCYAVMLYNGGELETINRMNSLVQEWSQFGFVSYTRFTSVILLNEKMNHVYMMSK